MSVARAQREIDAAEFAEWRAFEELEPFGSLTDARRLAALAVRLHAMAAGKIALEEDIYPELEE